LVALIAGAELFGLWGALFAAPLAGLLQSLIVAFWQNWRAEHPEEFPTGHTVEHGVAVVPVVSEAPKSIIMPGPISSHVPQPPDADGSASEPAPPDAVVDR
jgi:hypothetical protein